LRNPRWNVLNQAPLSCEKKKQLLWAEWLREEVLLPVAHRHVVFTVPRLLRPLFRRRRELLSELARAGAEALGELVRRGANGSEVRPGIIVSVATAGDLLQWHPHLHLITTDGGRMPDGSWHPLPEWDSVRLMTLFRERRFGRLLAQRAILQELVQKLPPTSSETPSRSRSSSTSTATRPCSTARG
jgi:hypothetical protein